MKLGLFKKYFQNKCSTDEAQEILDWIEKPDASMDMEDEFKSAWRNTKVIPGDYTKWSGKLEKVHERLEMEELYGSLDLEKKPKTWHKPKDRPAISGEEKQRNQTKKIRSVLIRGVFASFIILLGVVFYFNVPLSGEGVSIVAQLEKRTEPGQKLSFHLDDGTRVILNSGSKLFYPSSFDSLQRKVILVGEAYFEVSKDVDRPFRVVTESVVTTALGTAFNINAFSLNENIEVALVNGKVSVSSLEQTDNLKSLILNPGEMATVVKSDLRIEKSPFNFNEKISWKDGVIYFSETDYPEIVRKLENWYGVRIQEDKLPSNKWKFSGKFESETLDHILSVLQFGHDFEYKINGKEVNINF